MPPRPPLTTLVIHTWKEHGKPRPFATEELSENSARARIARSISIDAALSAQKIAGTSDEDGLPASFPNKPHLCGHLSRSSTFEDGLAVPVKQKVVAATERTEHAASEAMARLCGTEERIETQDAVALSAVPFRIYADDAFSSPVLLTPMGSEDEQEHVLTLANTIDTSESRHGMEALPPRPRRSQRRRNSTLGMCLSEAAKLRAANGNGVFGPTASSRTVQSRIHAMDSSPVRSPVGLSVARRRRARREGRRPSLLQESLLEQSTSFDTGLSAIARGHEAMK